MPVQNMLGRCRGRYWLRSLYWHITRCCSDCARRMIAIRWDCTRITLRIGLLWKHWWTICFNERTYERKMLNKCHGNVWALKRREFIKFNSPTNFQIHVPSTKFQSREKYFVFILYDFWKVLFLIKRRTELTEVRSATFGDSPSSVPIIVAGIRPISLVRKFLTYEIFDSPWFVKSTDDLPSKFVHHHLQWFQAHHLH